VSGTNSYPKTFCRVDSVASNKWTLDAAAGACVQYNEAKGRWLPSTNVGIASVGTPTNLTVGFAFIKQTAGEVSSTDLASVATSAVVTSVAGGLRRSLVGNNLHIASGTNDVPSWYEVVNWTDDNTITIDRDCTTGGNMSVGVGVIGGAMSMNSTIDDDFGETAVAGNVIFFKSGTISLGENYGITTGIGTAVANVTYEGYDSVWGDNPTGSSRPTFAAGTRQTTMGSFTKFRNIIFTTTHSSGWVFGLTQKVSNSKFVNSSTSDDAQATGSGAYDGVEAICYRGRAMQFGSSSFSVKNSYIHDSDIGILFTTTGTPRVLIENNIISSNLDALSFTGAALNGVQIFKNTLYGSENTTGTGISFPTASAGLEVKNNIIYGFVTGVDHADTQTDGWDDYNSYYNNDADVSATGEWQKGNNTIALDPEFTNVTQVTGTGASSSTNVLTDATKDFTALGFTTNDHVYLVSGTGTGFAARIYGITAVGTTTLTLTSNITSSGSGSDIVYQATLGHNYTPGDNMIAAGFPGTFGAATTSYTAIGAVQPQGGSSSTDLLGVMQ